MAKWFHEKSATCVNEMSWKYSFGHFWFLSRNGKSRSTSKHHVYDKWMSRFWTKNYLRSQIFLAKRLLLFVTPHFSYDLFKQKIIGNSWVVLQRISTLKARVVRACTVWKLINFSAKQILREIVGQFWV